MDKNIKCVGIDVVYTYVNMNDNEWSTKKRETREKYYDPQINNFDSCLSKRYEDNGELKYSLRSLEKFANWVRNIYIVTDNQKPEWINECDEITKTKLKFIDHKNIIPEKYLPTFNSHVIELFLHKIPNISSPFIYLNDDVILIKPLLPIELIPHENCYYVFLDKKMYTHVGEPNVSDYAFRSAWKNSNKWLDDNFKYERRRKMCHAPMVIYPDIIETLWSKMYSQLIITCEQRFRAITDINLLCSVYIYYGIYVDRAIESENVAVTIFNDDDENKKLNEIDEYTKFYCPNSTFTETTQKYLDNLFPEKSIFEE